MSKAAYRKAKRKREREERLQLGRGKTRWQRVAKAIRGSGGLLSVIAKRLGVSSTTVKNCLLREGPYWDKVRRRYKEECDVITDLAEATIHDVMSQRLDLAAASRTAQWYLARKAQNRGFADVSTVKMEGGTNPIALNVTQSVVPIEKLPLDLRVALLEALDQEEEQNPDEKKEKQ